MEKYDLRYIQIGMVASIALFFTIVGFDNIIDYQTNLAFVQHTLSMDATYQNPIMMLRAIKNSTVHHIVYLLIIFWQIATAILCWAGCILIHKKNSKQLAFIGLFLGFVLYMVGFITIAGEWYNIWQSPEYKSVLPNAGMFLSCIVFVMIFLKD